MRICRLIVTHPVGWDPASEASLNRPHYNLEEADLYQYLQEREVEWTFRRLKFMGVESPADLEFLYVEDLVEFGLPLEDAQCIMLGIHPEGTMRPDNPNGISLTTGEVCLFDRQHRQIPRVIQNRTLDHHAPGPPVPGLGVTLPTGAPDPYAEDWEELQGYERESAPPPPLEPRDLVDLDAPASSIDAPPVVSAIFAGESRSPQLIDQNSSSSTTASHVARVSPCGEVAWNGDLHALHAMRMQAIWDAESEEEFAAAAFPPGFTQGGMKRCHQRSFLSHREVPPLPAEPSITVVALSKLIRVSPLVFGRSDWHVLLHRPLQGWFRMMGSLG